MPLQRRIGSLIASCPRLRQARYGLLPIRQGLSLQRGRAEGSPAGGYRRGKTHARDHGNQRLRYPHDRPSPISLRRTFAVMLSGEADVRRVLAEASPDDTFGIRLPDNELKIWRIAGTEPWLPGSMSGYRYWDGSGSHPRALG